MHLGGSVQPFHTEGNLPRPKAGKMGSVVLPHLVTGWHVGMSFPAQDDGSFTETGTSDQAIMSEEERLVVIRFGRDYDPDCMRQDEVLYRSSPILFQR